MFSTFPGFGKKKEVVIVDHSLRDEAGHHLNVAQTLHQTLSEAGYKPCILAHQLFASRNHPQLAARALFKTHCYQFAIEAIRRPGRLEALRCQFGVEFDFHLRGTGANSIVLSTLTHVEMYAVAQWILSHPDPKSLEVYFWVVFGPEFLTTTSDQVQCAKAYYRQAFDILEQARETGARIVPFVETPGLHKQLQSMTDCPIEILRLPSMIHFRDQSSMRQPSPSKRVIVGYGGDVGPAGKGFEMLPDIINASASEFPDIRFDVHAASSGLLDNHPTLCALATMPDRVRLTTGGLSPTAFQRFLAGCDLILLPYAPDKYAFRGSSICIEAEALGIPQIVPATASFAQGVLDQKTAVGFSKYTSSDVAKALKLAVSSIDELRKNAAQQARQMSDQNQKFLEHFTHPIRSLNLWH